MAEWRKIFEVPIIKIFSLLNPLVVLKEKTMLSLCLGNEGKRLSSINQLIKCHNVLMFFRPIDVTASFSEMLLLLAIHVHSGQLSAITDLVCSTLGMRVSIRNHNMTRVKVIFMQEVFTEQVTIIHIMNSSS